MRQERTTKTGKGLWRMEFMRIWAVLPMRFDFMAVPLKAAHGQFCYAFA